MKVERTERRVSRGHASVGLGGARKTDTGQNTGDPRVIESSMLKIVIIWKMEVTCESKMYFILIWRKIQSR